MAKDAPANWVVETVSAPGQVWDTKKACRCVRDHAWRYPAGRYEDEIIRIREELGCAP